MTRFAFPLAGLVFGFAGLVVPIARHYARTGRLAVTLLHKDGLEGYLGAIMAGGIAGGFVYAALLAVLGPSALGVWDVPAGVLMAGGVLWAVGMVVLVVAQAQMGASWRIGIDAERTELVSRGLYTWVRNPIYTGLLLTLIGFVLLSPSAWTVMGALHLWTAVGLQTRLEERHLLAMHGDAYRRYADHVGRFFPGIGRGL